jgi:hypothetical protein
MVNQDQLRTSSIPGKDWPFQQFEPKSLQFVPRRKNTSPLSSVTQCGMPVATFTGCVPWNPQLSNEYGYRPSLAPGLAFDILFCTSMLLHIFQASWKRTWWTLVFALGALSKKDIHSTPRLRSTQSLTLSPKPNL